VFETVDEWADVRRSNDLTWMGLVDLGTEGAWRTASGHPPPTMIGWEVDEPNNSGGTGIEQDCGAVHFTFSGTWDDGTCAVANAYYCAEPQAPLDAARLCVEHPEICPFPFFQQASSSYLFVEEPMTWTRSLQLCRQMGMELATVDDAAEDAFLATMAGSVNAPHTWIGLHDQGQEGVFHWADGTPPDYTSWRLGRPDGGDVENCVRHWTAAEDGSGGRMSDVACDLLLPFACEAPTPLTACSDPDGDGYGDGCMGGPDCAPMDGLVSPGAVDKCDSGDTDVSCNLQDGNDQICGCTLVTSLGGRDTLYCGYQLPWNQAQNVCIDLGGTLAIVDEQARQSQLASFMGEVASFSWLGLTDAALETDWRWVDGSSVVYENWAGGQPDNGTNNGGTAQNCAGIDALDPQRWRDLPCGWENPFFCDVP
jgi:hypothetical protein